MNSAKFAFYYMLSLVTLIIISLSFGNILFEMINKFFPDIAKTIYYYSDSPIKGAISGILIATPIFYFVMNKIYKSLKSGELKKDSSVRRWLTYFILFVSSVVVIGSLIAILNNFLDGALTVNSVLKILTVLFIAALIFGFYFYDIKRGDFKDYKINAIFFYISLALISAAFISSFFLIDSPQESRNRKLDDKILSDFNTIKFAIDNYYNENEKLPQNLNDVESKIIKPYNGSLDYEYEITGDKKYKLCAEFMSSNLEKIKTYSDNNWKHDKGYQCIEKEVDIYNKVIY
ncbi:MAG: DUF5671 domain-containing protein [Candidatus Pacebacteria bacterium]|nr:DUF5671 domain-containing protein [Candidatus Paceibacterota bacterium]